MTTLTLDQLRSDIEQEYAPLTIDLGNGQKTVLKRLLRLPEDKQAKAAELLEKFEAVDESATALTAMRAELVELIETVADANGPLLTQALGGDLALLLEIVKRWAEETQPGEAERSPDSSTSTAAS